MTRAKTGVLRQHTYIHTATNLVIKVRKGTTVSVSKGVLIFNPVEGVQVMKVQSQYFICLWGSVYSVVFPKGGKVPYPLSML